MSDTQGRYFPMAPPPATHPNIFDLLTAVTLSVTDFSPTPVPAANVALTFTGNGVGPNANALWGVIKGPVAGPPPFTHAHVEFFADPLTGGASIALGAVDIALNPATDTYGPIVLTAPLAMPAGIYEVSAVLTFWSGPTAATLYAAALVTPGAFAFVGDALMDVHP
jgi:hypothetical protein